MNRRIVLASFISACALSFCDVVRGQPAASHPSRITLEISLPPGPVLDGQVSPTCVIRNLEPKRIVVCVLGGGYQWAYRVPGGTVSTLTVSDADVCETEFPLDPGQARSWKKQLHAPDITSGNLELQLDVLIGPRHSPADAEPAGIHLTSQTIPIEIVGTQ